MFLSLALLAVPAAAGASSTAPQGLLVAEPDLDRDLDFEVSPGGKVQDVDFPFSSSRSFGPVDGDAAQHLRQAVPRVALPQLLTKVAQPDPPTADPAAPTVAPTVAPTADPAATAAPPTEAPTVPPTAAPPTAPPIAGGQNAIVIAPVDSTPPPPDRQEERALEYQQEFEANDPLLQDTIWSKIGMPMLVTGGIIMVLMVIILLAVQGSDEVEENELQLPENMYGETFATVIMVTNKFHRDGGKTLPAMCELFSSMVLLGVTYMLVYIMIGVAENTIGSVEQDVEERDSLFEKFRDPVLWQAQNWQLYPDSVWRRDSMVWFCHDIIYGKAKHVNELGPIWYLFSWVVLVVWFSYMLFELREVFKLKLMIWNTPTVPAQDMVTPNKEEGKIIVNGLCYSVKGWLTLLVLLPKLALNLMVSYVGCVFLLYNDLDDDLQEVLLKTIEMAFILEMDELVFEAFAATPKKQQLSQMEMPTVVEKGLWRVLSQYGEFPRFMLCVGLASYLSITVNNDTARRMTLTSKEAGVIEGCCNFMQYVKGAGVKTALAEGNPCSQFRETYETPMGLDATGGILPPGDHPAPGAATAGGDPAEAVMATVAPVAGALIQAGGRLAMQAFQNSSQYIIGNPH